MKLLRVAIACSALIALAGCDTMSPEQARVQEDQSCADYGFKPGTDEFAKCMMQLDQTRIANNAEARRRFGEAMVEMSNQMRANRPVTCTSNGYGNASGFGNTVNFNHSSTTTCY